MIETKRFHCEECDHYWEITSKAIIPRYCETCDSSKIHRVTGDRRYSRKARQKVRWSHSGTIRG
jgi:Zn finger protein HypA/HybF involved in hydrogenase expression